jgi:hypothetical protein
LVTPTNKTLSRIKYRQGKMRDIVAGARLDKAAAGWSCGDFLSRIDANGALGRADNLTAVVSNDFPHSTDNNASCLSEFWSKLAASRSGPVKDDKPLNLQEDVWLCIPPPARRAAPDRRAGRELAAKIAAGQARGGGRSEALLLQLSSSPALSHPIVP